jgi:ribosomal-protein-alanine N-acetyltransferase
MRYEFTPMTEAEANEIAAWHYEPPYDFYDVVNDPEQETEILDPEYRAAHYHAVRDEKGDLVGFFEYKAHGEELEVGLGLRPDLVGAGIGADFVQSGLEFGRQLHSPTRFTLEVAKFNDRARLVYQRVGFTISGESTHTILGKEWNFHKMSRPT